jgi:hypothetical protein
MQELAKYDRLHNRKIAINKFLDPNKFGADFTYRFCTGFGIGKRSIPLEQSFFFNFLSVLCNEFEHGCNMEVLSVKSQPMHVLVPNSGSVIKCDQNGFFQLRRSHGRR